jgi:hypothetical protein
MALISQPGSDYQIVSISLDAGYTRDLNRPGIDGDSEPTKGWSHASTKEVPG